jgi:hypothetical protein
VLQAVFETRTGVGDGAEYVENGGVVLDPGVWGAAWALCAHGASRFLLTSSEVEVLPSGSSDKVYRDNEGETMEFTDAELAAQPIGYWSGAANTAIIQHINDRMGELGVTQRHWWSLYQVGESDKGLTRQELLTLMRRIRPYVDASTMEPAIDDLLMISNVGGNADFG